MAFPPPMINFEPRIFVNITPIIPNGVTIVDLGEFPEDESEGVEVPRSSSLPPISVPRRSHGRGEGRHGSLPPMSPTFRMSNIGEEEVGETGSDGSAGPAGPAGAGDSDGDTTSSQGEPERNEVPLRNSRGIKLIRASAGIKKEKIKTGWIIQWNKKAMIMPPILHSSVQLELGDLFINQYFSQQHGAHVLQVWLLVVNGSSYRWKQIGQDEKVHHPTLKKRVLSFQPNASQITPTWILSNTERRRKDMPLIVLG